jgi:hypothetical protein
MSAARGGRLLLAAATLAVAAAVIGGALLLGSPAEQRRLRLDTARTSDLERLQRLIERFAKDHRELPDTLSALGTHSGYDAGYADPESGAPYEYRRVSASAFQLCATFATDSARDKEAFDQPVWVSGDDWEHGAGRHCFERHIVLPNR